MSIDKLTEFSKTGDKNTDDLDLEKGFPIKLQPARQWFNWLLNKITRKINEVIDGLNDQYNDLGQKITTVDNKLPDKLDKTATAAKAVKLETNREIKLSGDVLGVGSFDGSSDLDINVDLKGFESSLDINGYKKFGDLIIQWGTVDYAANPGEMNVNVIFPIAFPNACLNVGLTRKQAAQGSNGDGGASLINATTDSMTISLQVFNSTSIDSLRGFSWIAIGL